MLTCMLTCISACAALFPGVDAPARRRLDPTVRRLPPLLDLYNLQVLS